jgi:hypothetical protein
MEPHDLYDPHWPAYGNIMHHKTGLLSAAREVLLASGELYDPEHHEMHIAEHDVFRYNVSMGLWDLALHCGASVHTAKRP